MNIQNVKVNAGAAWYNVIPHYSSSTCVWQRIGKVKRATQQAWAAARMSATPMNIDLLANPDVLDQLIIWRMADPRFGEYPTGTRKEGNMQRQWTIEARADFAEKEKNDAIDQAFKVAAAHINTTMVLLSDGQKPQVVCFSDDFFAGHQEIDWLGDPLGDAIKKHHVESGETTQVSDEMLQAVRELKAK